MLRGFRLVQATALVVAVIFPGEHALGQARIDSTEWQVPVLDGKQPDLTTFRKRVSAERRVFEEILAAAGRDDSTALDDPVAQVLADLLVRLEPLPLSSLSAQQLATKTWPMVQKVLDARDAAEKLYEEAQAVGLLDWQNAAMRRTLDGFELLARAVVRVKSAAENRRDLGIALGKIDRKRREMLADPMHQQVCRFGLSSALAAAVRAACDSGSLSGDELQARLAAVARARAAVLDERFTAVAKAACSGGSTRGLLCELVAALRPARTDGDSPPGDAMPLVDALLMELKGRLFNLRRLIARLTDPATKLDEVAIDRATWDMAMAQLQKRIAATSQIPLLDDAAARLRLAGLLLGGLDRGPDAVKALIAELSEEELKKRIDAFLDARGGASREAALRDLIEAAETALRRLKVLETLTNGIYIARGPKGAVRAVAAELKATQQGIRAELELEFQIGFQVDASGVPTHYGLPLRARAELNIPLDLKLPTAQALAQFEQSLRQALATTKFAGGANSGVAEILASLAFPHGLPVTAMRYSAATGLEIDLAGECFTIDFGAAGQTPLCPVVTLATADRLVDALRKDIVAKLNAEKAAFLDRLPGKQDVLASVNNAIEKIPIDCAAGICRIVVPLDDLKPVAAGSHATIQRDAAGKVTFGVNLSLQHKVALLTGVPNIIVKKVISDAHDEPTKVAAVVELGRNVAVDLGEIVLGTKIELPRLPNAVTIPVGSGFALELQADAPRLVNGRIIFEGVTLRALPPFGEIKGLDLTATATLKNDEFRVEWTAEGSDARTVAREVTRALRRSGILPEDVSIAKWVLAADGLHVEFEIPSHWTPAQRQVLEKLRVLGESFRHDLVTGELEPALAAVRSRVGAVTRSQLQAWLTNGCPTPSRKEVAMGTLEVTCVPGRSVKVLLTLAGETMKLGVQATLVNGALHLAPINEKAWLINYVNSTLQLGDPSNITAKVEGDPIRISVDGKVRVHDEELPFGVKVGLGGNVEILLPQAKTIFERLRKPVQAFRDKVRDSLLAEANKAARLLVPKNCDVKWDERLGSPPPAVLICDVEVEVAGRKLALRNIRYIRYTATSSWDFSEASFQDDGALAAAVSALSGAAKLHVERTHFSKQAIIVVIKVSIPLPELSDRPFEATVNLEIGPDTAKLDLENKLAELLATSIMQQFVPRELGTKDVAIVLRNAEARGKAIELTGVLRVAAGIDLDLPFTVLVPVANPGDIVVRVERPDVSAITGRLLKLIALPAFDNVPTPQVERLDAAGNVIPWEKLSVPHALRFTITIPFLSGRIVVHGLELDRRGVRKLQGISVTIPDINITPFILAEPRATITRDELVVRAKLTVGEGNVKHIVHLAGEFRLNLGQILKDITKAKIESVSRLVLFTFLEMAQQTQTIDVAKKELKNQVDIGGPLSRLVSLRGETTVRPWVLDGDVKARLFGIPLHDAKLRIDLGTGQIYVDGQLDVPLTGFRGGLRADPGFKNAAFLAEHAMELFGLKLSGMKLEVTIRQAKLTFSVLGINMSLVVPSIAGLTPDALKKLLTNLISPDLSKLDDALLAVLRGNFTINPFASFGGKDGGVQGEGGDSGEKTGAGGSDASSSGDQGGNGSDRESRKGAFDELAQRTDAAPALVTPLLQPGAVTSHPGVLFQGPRGKAYHIRALDGGLWVTEEGDTPRQKHVLVTDVAAGTKQFVEDSTAGEYFSVGRVLTAGPRFFAHALDQAVPGGCDGMAYVFSSKGALDPVAARIPLWKLHGSFCFDSIEATRANTAQWRGFTAFLQGSAWALTKGAGPDQIDAVRYVAAGRTHLFLAHHVGERYFRAYASTNDREHAVLFPIWNGELAASASDATLIAIANEALEKADPAKAQGDLYTAPGVSLSSLDGRLFVLDSKSMRAATESGLGAATNVESLTAWDIVLPSVAPTKAEETISTARLEHVAEEEKAAKALSAGVVFNRGNQGYTLAIPADGRNVVEASWVGSNAVFAQAPLGAPWFTQGTPVGHAKLAVVTTGLLVAYDEQSGCKTTFAWFTSTASAPTTLPVDVCVRDILASATRTDIWARWLYSAGRQIAAHKDRPRFYDEIVNARVRGTAFDALITQMPGDAAWTVVGIVDHQVVEARLFVTDEEFFRNPTQVRDALAAAHERTGVATVAKGKRGHLIVVADAVLASKTAALEPVAVLHPLDGTLRLEEILQRDTTAAKVLREWLADLDTDREWEAWVTLRDFKHRNDAVVARERGNSSGAFAAVVATHDSPIPAPLTLRILLGDIKPSAQSGLLKQVQEQLDRHPPNHYRDCILDVHHPSKESAVSELAKRLGRRRDEITALMPPADSAQAASPPFKRIAPGNLEPLLTNADALDSYLTLLHKQDTESAHVSSGDAILFVIARPKQTAGGAPKSDTLWALTDGSPTMIGELPRVDELRDHVFAVARELWSPGSRWSPKAKLIGTTLRLASTNARSLVYLIPGKGRRKVETLVGEAAVLESDPFIASLAEAAADVTVLHHRCQQRCTTFVLDGQQLEAWHTKPSDAVLLGRAPALPQASTAALKAFFDDVLARIEAKKTIETEAIAAFSSASAGVDALRVVWKGDSSVHQFYYALGDQPRVVAITDDLLGQRDAAFLGQLLRLPPTGTVQILGQSKRPWAFVAKEVYGWRGGTLERAGSTQLSAEVRPRLVQALEKLKPGDQRVANAFAEAEIVGANVLRLQLNGETFSRLQTREGGIFSLQSSAADLSTAAQSPTLALVLANLVEGEAPAELLYAGATPFVLRDGNVETVEDDKLVVLGALDTPADEGLRLSLLKGIAAFKETRKARPLFSSACRSQATAGPLVACVRLTDTAASEWLFVARDGNREAIRLVDSLDAFFDGTVAWLPQLARYILESRSSDELWVGRSTGAESRRFLLDGKELRIWENSTNRFEVIGSIDAREPKLMPLLLDDVVTARTSGGAGSVLQATATLTRGDEIAMIAMWQQPRTMTIYGPDPKQFGRSRRVHLIGEAKLLKEEPAFALQLLALDTTEAQAYALWSVGIWLFVVDTSAATQKLIGLRKRGVSAEIDDERRDVRLAIPDAPAGPPEIIVVAQPGEAETEDVYIAEKSDPLKLRVSHVKNDKFVRDLVKFLAPFSTTDFRQLRVLDQGRSSLRYFTSQVSAVGDNVYVWNGKRIIPLSGVKAKDFHSLFKGGVRDALVSDKAGSAFENATEAEVIAMTRNGLTIHFSPTKLLNWCATSRINIKDANAITEFNKKFKETMKNYHVTCNGNRCLFEAAKALHTDNLQSKYLQEQARVVGFLCN